MTTRLAATLVLAIAATASAEPALLGVCQSLDDVRCSRATEWSVSKTTDTPTLTDPNNSTARFRIVVTEGATQHWITLRGGLMVTGLMSPGTNILSIVLNLQKFDSALGGWTNVASAAVGDPLVRCECPVLEGGSLTLRVWDSSGNSIPATPGAILTDLPFGETGFMSLDARYDLNAGIVTAQDTLRISTCISYRQAGASWPEGCFLDGGGVLNTQACSDIPPDACAPEQQTIQLTEALHSLTPDIAGLTGFRASTASAAVSPNLPRTLEPGGSALYYAVHATGQTGTQSIIDIEGKVTCDGTCTDPAGCHATLTNAATLVPSETWPDALDTPVNGSPANATIDVTCHSTTPPPILVGDFCTFTQGGWGATCNGNNPGCLLHAHFASVFGEAASCSAPGGLVVGTHSPGQMRFINAAAVTAYLPAGGPARALSGGPLCNPLKTSSGVLGGQVTALKLSVSFSDAGRLPQQSPLRLGDLVLASGPCAGLTVRQLLDRAESALSGVGLTGFCSSLSDLNEAADRINNNFDNCNTNLGALVLP